MALLLEARRPFNFAHILTSARLVLTPPNYGREIILPNLYAIEPNLPRIRLAVAETFAGTSKEASSISSGPPAQGGTTAEVPDVLPP